MFSAKICIQGIKRVSKNQAAKDSAWPIERSVPRFLARGPATCTPIPVSLELAPWRGLGFRAAWPDRWSGNFCNESHWLAITGASSSREACGRTCSNVRASIATAAASFLCIVQLPCERRRSPRSHRKLIHQTFSFIAS